MIWNSSRCHENGVPGPGRGGRGGVERPSHLCRRRRARFGERRAREPSLRSQVVTPDLTALVLFPSLSFSFLLFPSLSFSFLLRILVPSVASFVFSRLSYYSLDLSSAFHHPRRSCATSSRTSPRPSAARSFSSPSAPTTTRLARSATRHRSTPRCVNDAPRRVISRRSTITNESPAAAARSVMLRLGGLLGRGGGGRTTRAARPRPPPRAARRAPRRRAEPAGEEAASTGEAGSSPSATDRAKRPAVVPAQRTRKAAAARARAFTISTRRERRFAIELHVFRGAPRPLTVGRRGQARARSLADSARLLLLWLQLTSSRLAARGGCASRVTRASDVQLALWIQISRVEPDFAFCVLCALYASDGSVRHTTAASPTIAPSNAQKEHSAAWWCGVVILVRV